MESIVSAIIGAIISGFFSVYVAYVQHKLTKYPNINASKDDSSTNLLVKNSNKGKIKDYSSKFIFIFSLVSIILSIFALLTKWIADGYFVSHGQIYPFVWKIILILTTVSLILIWKKSESNFTTSASMMTIIFSILITIMELYRWRISEPFRIIICTLTLFSVPMLLLLKKFKRIFLTTLHLLPLLILTPQFVLSLRYDDAEWWNPAGYSEGLMRVSTLGHYSNEDNKYGFVDGFGLIVIPCKYDFAASFSDGLAVVGQRELMGYIDKTGDWVIKPKYKFADDFQYGKAIVTYYDKHRDNNGHYETEYFEIDKDGNEIPNSKFWK